MILCYVTVDGIFSVIIVQVRVLNELALEQKHAYSESYSFEGYLTYAYVYSVCVRAHTHMHVCVCACVRHTHTQYRCPCGQVWLPREFLAVPTKFYRSVPMCVNNCEFVSGRFESFQLCPITHIQ
jgi:hypothetical protein